MRRGKSDGRNGRVVCSGLGGAVCYTLLARVCCASLSFCFFSERGAVSAGLLGILLLISGDGSPHGGLLVLTAKCSAVALDGIE